MRAEVTICKWTDYNPRKDLKATKWFRLENTWWRDPKFFELDHDQKLVWIALLSMASEKQTGSFTINTKLIAVTLQTTENRVNETLTILQGMCVIDVDVRTNENPRPADVTSTSRPRTTTKRDETKRDETNETGTHPPPAAKALPKLAELWNEHAPPGLARVKSMAPNSSRRKNCEARWREWPDPDYWRQVIKRIGEIPGLLGKADGGWRADIEFLARPDSAAKILEGKYDSWGPKGSGERKTFAQQRSENNMRLLEEFKREGK